MTYWSLVSDSKSANGTDKLTDRRTSHHHITLHFLQDVVNYYNMSTCVVAAESVCGQMSFD